MIALNSKTIIPFNCQNTFFCGNPTHGHSCSDNHWTHPLWNILGSIGNINTLKKKICFHWANGKGGVLISISICEWCLYLLWSCICNMLSPNVTEVIVSFQPFPNWSNRCSENLLSAKFWKEVQPACQGFLQTSRAMYVHPMLRDGL